MRRHLARLVHARPFREDVVRLESRPLLGRPDRVRFVELFLPVDFLLRIRRQLHERAPGAPHRRVRVHLAVVLVVLTGERRQPPDRLETHVGIRLAPEFARHLRDIFEPPFAEHLDDLAVPLVVFLR